MAQIYPDYGSYFLDTNNKIKKDKDKSLQYQENNKITEKEIQWREDSKALSFTGF